VRAEEIEGEFIFYRLGNECTTAVGYDYVWGQTRNSLTYANNIKMKLSVIFGVFHMCLGIGIKGTNAIYFRQFVVLICEVFAGFIILFGLFGWMDVLIFLKWFYPLDIEDRTIINWDELEDQLNQDNEFDPKFKGDYDNEHMPSIV
jgi:hypothetical protein